MTKEILITAFRKSYTRLKTDETAAPVKFSPQEIADRINQNTEDIITLEEIHQYMDDYGFSLKHSTEKGFYYELYETT